MPQARIIQFIDMGTCAHGTWGRQSKNSPVSPAPCMAEYAPYRRTDARDNGRGQGLMWIVELSFGIERSEEPIRSQRRGQEMFEGVEHTRTGTTSGMRMLERRGRASGQRGSQGEAENNGHDVERMNGVASCMPAILRRRRRGTRSAGPSEPGQASSIKPDCSPGSAGSRIGLLTLGDTIHRWCQRGLQRTAGTSRTPSTGSTPTCSTTA